MILLNVVLVGVIMLLGHQLYTAFTQGKIYGRNKWFGYSSGWIYAKKQSALFNTTLVAYLVGFIGAIFIFILHIS